MAKDILNDVVRSYGHEAYTDEDRQRELGLNVDPMKEEGFTHGVDDNATFDNNPQGE